MATPKNPTRKSTGRPSKLSQDLQDRLVAIISRGHYATTACAAVGLGEATYFRWMELGADHLEVRGGKRVLVRARPRFREFREAIENAKAQAQMLALEAIRDAAFEVKEEDELTPSGVRKRKVVKAKNWTAAAWFLERTRPDLYARRDVLHSGDGPEPKEPDSGPRQKVVRFGGRFRPDGSVQTSAGSTDKPAGE